MKIGTPELKTKPATKYGDHYYISFSTVNKELFYKITIFGNNRDQYTFANTKRVVDADHLKRLLSKQALTQLMELEA